MNELALFAGAGGGILGGKLLGWKTVCVVEHDPYARDILVSRQNDGCLEACPVWDDVCTFDGKPWRGRVDVVSGGFPCQDISAAGKGAGISGERSGLWVEMARIIGEVRPRFAFVENSAVLTSRGLGTCLGDLAAMGYDARWGVVGANAAGAPHKRERIWIVADDPRCGWRTGRAGRPNPSSAGESEQPLQDVPDAIRTERESGARGRRVREGNQAMADSEPTRLEGHRGDSGKQEVAEPRNGSPLADSDCIYGDDGGHGASPIRGKQRREPSDLSGSESDVGNTDSIDGRTRAGGQDGAEARDASWWATEPDVGRVAHGVASRVDRLRCIGNGQVPGVAALAWEILTAMNNEHAPHGDHNDKLTHPERTPKQNENTN